MQGQNPLPPPAEWKKKEAQMSGKEPPKQHHVVPNKERGGWDIKKPGADRCSGHYDKKDEAMHEGRKISQNQGTELVEHGKHGQIIGSDSHGHDPCPPKDKH